MVKLLKIKNFRSIRETLIVNFLKSSKYDKNDLSDHYFNKKGKDFLKSLVVYGRNASGKSNILMAFRAIEYMVLHSREFKLEETIPPYEPFAFDKKFQNQPIEFEIHFFDKDNIEYHYSFSYTNKKIINEALHFYPNNVKSKLYVRKGNKFSYGEYYKGSKKSIEKDLLPNQLFLSKSATEKILYLNNVFLFFFRTLRVFTDPKERAESSLINNFCENLQKNPLVIKNMKKLLKAADTNILDFTIEQNDDTSFEFPDNVPEDIKKKVMQDFKYEVKTKHNLFDSHKEIGLAELSLEKESLGTKKLMAIGSLIIVTLMTGKTLVIDELDKGLHPLLTRMLIGLFNSKKNNPKNAQLIIATHDTSLLDNLLLRRDQIYITDKEYEGNSVLYKMSDIKGIRKDIPFEKWYLSGRFRGVPIIGDLELEFK